MFALALGLLLASDDVQTRVVPIGLGWSKNSVNATVFRESSVTSFGETQYVAYYDGDSTMVIAKRKLSSTVWERNRTQYKGNTSDAHNGISIGVDGSGLLHVSWNHHGNRLNYATAVAPGSIELGERQSMTGSLENSVTYPQFFNLPDGRLLFFYRDGGSGNGNLVLNRYNPAIEKWQQLHANLIDGEGERNAYWQACVDEYGGLHISWVWRETGDVATNHDLCYAYSEDAGVTWRRSDGSVYEGKINEQNAQVVARIPQNSELINQTSMAAKESHLVIAGYWRPSGASAPQVMLVSLTDGGWKTEQVSDRTLDFKLSGGGTKRLSLSRPQVMVGKAGPLVVYRDEERGGRVVLARKKEGAWTLTDLTSESVGMWEPTYDRALWKHKGELHLFLQKVDQIDAEGLADTEPTVVSVLEVRLR